MFVAPAFNWLIKSSSTDFPSVILQADTEDEAIALFRTKSTDTIISISSIPNSGVPKFSFTINEKQPLASVTEIDTIVTGAELDNSGSPGPEGSIYITGFSIHLGTATPESGFRVFVLNVQWANYEESTDNIAAFRTSPDGNTWTQQSDKDDNPLEFNITGSSGFYVFNIEMPDGEGDYWWDNFTGFMQVIDSTSNNVFSQIIPIEL